MREILFRGKRLDNGEWIEGNFYESGISGAFILQNKTRKTIDAKTGEITLRDEPIPFEVLTSTIGQYTGTNDNHCKKIFEGDIIRKTNEGRHPQIFTANIHTHFCVNEEVYYSPCDHFTESCEYEIIGNIHDNPELLEK